MIVTGVAVCTFVLAGALVKPAAQSAAPRTVRFAATGGLPLRQWDSRIDAFERNGDLVLRSRRDDTVLGGRTHERFDQYYQGVHVFGGDVTRQTDAVGVTMSLFGTWYDGIALDPTPTLSVEAARAAIAAEAGIDVSPNMKVELVVLPLDAGGYALAYRGRAFGPDGLFMYFIDARSGAVLLRYNDLKTQAALGVGTGVLNDQKKLSVTQAGTTYRAIDAMRPPALVTYDLRGNLTKVLNFFNGFIPLTTSDVAADADNTWGDPAIVDAHAYAGWVYDYYFKRFGRRGLDNANIQINSIVHPVNRNDITRQPASVVGTFYLNAAYVGDGIIYYGEGLPPGFRDSTGHSWNYLAGALDVIAHELTHGVTDYSSQLIYRNESGALNEAFSDIMGTSVEFFFQPPGDGIQKSDYLIGEDVVTPGGIRSMKNPIAFGDPDHYSLRYTGTQDNGGVHTNSGIANHAFYLAIEGGTNRVSGITVQGVGAGNREQIEKVFYRGFTQLMPASATYAVARAVTLQAARDLYGVGSAPERAVAAAWTAVGVN
jgi:thermolysin